jgi:hypothetical protein
LGLKSGPGGRCLQIKAPREALVVFGYFFQKSNGLKLNATVTSAKDGKSKGG